MFALIGEFSGLGQQMLLTKVCRDCPWLLWQHNLGQNGL